MTTVMLVINSDTNFYTNSRTMISENNSDGLLNCPIDTIHKGQQIPTWHPPNIRVAKQNVRVRYQKHED